MEDASQNEAFTEEHFLLAAKIPKEWSEMEVEKMNYS